MTMSLKVNIFLLVLMVAAITALRGRFDKFNDENQRYKRSYRNRKFILSSQLLEFLK